MIGSIRHCFELPSLYVPNWVIEYIRYSSWRRNIQWLWSPIHSWPQKISSVSWQFNLPYCHTHPIVFLVVVVLVTLSWTFLMLPFGKKNIAMESPLWMIFLFTAGSVRGFPSHAWLPEGKLNKALAVIQFIQPNSQDLHIINLVSMLCHPSKPFTPP